MNYNLIPLEFLALLSTGQIVYNTVTADVSSCDQ